LTIDGWVYDPIRKVWIHPKSGRVIPIIRGGGKAVVIQQAFWFRNNDGNEATATFMGAQGSDQSIPTGTTFRIRIITEETAGGTSNIASNLYASWQGGTYFDVTTSSSYIQAVDEGQGIADDTLLTTQRLTYSGTWVDGRYDDNGVATTASTLTNSFTENEFSLTIVDADVSAGHTIDLRIRDSAAALDSYAVTPRITVSGGARTPRQGFTLFQVPGTV
jgi:hypothetical protein